MRWMYGWAFEKCMPRYHVHILSIPGYKRDCCLRYFFKTVTGSYSFALKYSYFPRFVIGLKVKILNTLSPLVPIYVTLFPLRNPCELHTSYCFLLMCKRA